MQTNFHSTKTCLGRCTIKSNKTAKLYKDKSTKAVYLNLTPQTINLHPLKVHCFGAAPSADASNFNCLAFVVGTNYMQ